MYNYKKMLKIESSVATLRSYKNIQTKFKVAIKEFDIFNFYICILDLILNLVIFDMCSFHEFYFIWKSQF